MILFIWVPYLGWIFAFIAGLFAGLVARGAGRGALAGFVAGIIGSIIAGIPLAWGVLAFAALRVFLILGLAVLGLATLGGLVGGAVRPRRLKNSVRAESTSGPYSPRPVSEVKTPRQCRMCHSMNPPYAINYCIKCGSRLD